MKKEELLEYLRLAFGYEDDSEKFNQAHEQIVALIGASKEVTEEWINEKAKEFWSFPYYDCSFQDVQDFIRSLVKEINCVA